MKAIWSRFAPGKYDLYRDKKLIAYVQRCFEHRYWLAHVRSPSGYFLSLNRTFPTMTEAKKAAIAKLK